MSVADIGTASAASVVKSITVVQVEGAGAITGDSGGGFTLLQGETFTWAASDDGLDTLTGSALAAITTGEQHVTAIYYV